MYVTMIRLPKLTMASLRSISEVLRSILEQELFQNSGFLSEENCNALLLSEESIPPVYGEKGKYPKHPLYVEISKKLLLWMEEGDFPVKNEDCGLLTERDSNEKRKEITGKVTPILTKLKMSWAGISYEEKAHQLTLVVKIIGVRGLLDLLNIRQTQGSVDVFPPLLSTLVASFNKKHKPNANLVVGARALSKHCHRDVTNEWWGPCAGSELVKNEHANAILMRILEDASWINIHLLPHNLKVIEVRGVGGYGARWSHDGMDFRGFLEPQMEDGHATGWKH